MKTKKILFALAIIFLVLAPLIASQSENSLPPNILKIQEYNKNQADFYLKNLSFLIAFLAGIIGILSPCSLAILPAFFAFSFKEKKEITKMTFAFFLGFAPVFMIFGLIATWLGKTLAMFQQQNSFLVTVAGIFIILFGILAFFGKGFSGINIKRKNDKSYFGIFIFGVLFAVGFTACMGPILVGMLLIAGVLQNYFYSGILMLFYSLGLFVPLFLISIFFDKYNFAKIFDKANKRVGFSITNVLSGILLVGIGLFFIIDGGTIATHSLGLGGFSSWVYQLQKSIVGLPWANAIGLILLAGLIYFLFSVFRKKKKKN